MMHLIKLNLYTQFVYIYFLLHTYYVLYVGIPNRTLHSIMIINILLLYEYILDK